MQCCDAPGKYLSLFNPSFFLQCLFSLETVVMPQAAAVHGFHHHGCSQPRLYRIDLFSSFISMTVGGVRLCLPFPLLATQRHRWLQRVKSSSLRMFSTPPWQSDSGASGRDLTSWVPDSGLNAPLLADPPVVVFGIL